MRTRLWDPSFSAAADRHSLGVLGRLDPVLMERAALALADWVGELVPDPVRVCVLCGPGNNGGDGVALARMLHLRGWPVEVYLVCGRRGASIVEQSDAAQAFGVSIHEGLPPAELEAGLYVDALLGTGSQGAPRGQILEAVEWLSNRRRVLAVDLPSGLDGATGSVAGAAVRADYTLTFARSMPGLHLGMVAERRGRLRVADIGLVADPESRVEDCALLIDPAQVGAQLEGIGPAAHKGRRGHVLVIGGSAGTEGASILSGAGALGGGSGLVTLCSASSALVEAALAQRPELMRCAWGQSSWSSIGDVLVVGPGLTDPGQLAEVEALWAEDARPAVWDASALSLELRAGAKASRVITPHPKEAAGLLSRLSGESWEVARVQSDRLAAARELAERTGAVVVLKGAGSVICDGERCFINTTGDERLATAGSGDVLAGLIAALLARGLDASAAARVGVHLHGLAGERQASVGARALDLADVLAEVMAGPDYRGQDWPEFVLA